MKKMIGIDKVEQEIKKYQKYDIFAGKIPINVHKIESISSYEGTCLTFVFYILMILYIFLNSPGDLVWRKLPSVSQSYMNQDVTHVVNFTDKEFFFYFNLFNGKNIKFDDDTYVYTKLRIKSYYHNETRETKNTYFDLHPCKEENLTRLKPHERDVIKGDYLCPNFKNFEIHGSSLENTTNLAQILVYPCYHDNLDGNNRYKRKCKSQKEIESFIYNNMLKIKIMYPVPIVRTLNLDDPMSYKMKVDYFYLGNDLEKYRYVNYNFDKIELQTDTNLILSRTTSKFEYEMKSVSQDTRKTDSDDQRFFSIDLRSSFLLTTYKRVYLKLLDCLSIIGGFYPILFMLFEIFHSFFSQISILEFMIDKIFNINNPLDYKQKKKVQIDKIKLEQNNNNDKDKKNKPNGRASWWRGKTKSPLDRSDMLFGPSSSIELKNNFHENENIENNDKFIKKDNQIDDNNNVIDLRSKIHDFNDLSENRNIFSKKTDKNNKDITESIFKREKPEENVNIKDYYIQTLKNMRLKENIKFETEFKAYFNWTKIVGYGKNKDSKNYKLKKLLEKIQDKVEDYFDYLNVIRCIDELELIKSLIFDSHELPLISVMRIPIVDLGKDFDLDRFNLKSANHLEENIKDEDMQFGIEKLLSEGKNSSCSQKILRHLRNLDQ